MNKTALLTAILALTPAATAPQKTALDEWVNHWGPLLTDQAKTLLGGNFGFSGLGKLAQDAVNAAQDLKGIFSGTDRAKIAQAVLHTTVATLAPDRVKKWALPLVDGPAVAALIESAFRYLEGAGLLKMPALPEVAAPEVEAGGVQ